MKQETANLPDKEAQDQFILAMNSDNKKAKDRIADLRTEIEKLEPQAFAKKNSPSSKQDIKTASPTMVFKSNLLSNYRNKLFHLFKLLSIVLAQILR